VNREVVDFAQRRLPRPPRRAERGRRERRPYGRAWINGREVGGADPRYAHLAAGYD
jgi:hypothetical protein